MPDPETETTKASRLIGTNYNVWSIELQGKLMTANLCRVTTGQLEKPKGAAEVAERMLKKERKQRKY
jgi:hypothetical protein